MKKIVVVSLCDGISIGRYALEQLGYEVDYYRAEIKETANKVAMTQFPDSHNLGDVTKVRYKDGILYSELGNYNVGHINMVIFGSPCFVGDTLVLTQDGYKNIKDIKVGDYVLSHDNCMHRVSNHIMTGVEQIWNVDAMGSDELKTTENHKFYVRKKIYKYDSTTRHNKRTFLNPEWVEVKDLDDTYYIGYAINTESKIPEWNGIDIWKQGTVHHKCDLDMNNKDFWYIVGRWLGDGWLNKSRPGKYRNEYKGIKICCSKEESDELGEKISKVFHYTKISEKTVDKFQINNVELGTFLSQFGSGAENKIVPKFVMDLPVDLLLEFLDGYFDSDGSFIKKTGFYQCCSVSRELIYGIGQCIAKVFHRPFTIAKKCTNTNKRNRGSYSKSETVVDLKI